MAEFNIEKMARNISKRALEQEYNGKPIREWIDEIVKRTTPRPVIFECTGYADGAPVYDYANCPSCGYSYEEGDKDWGKHFCPRCGQALNWEILEEGAKE